LFLVWFWYCSLIKKRKEELKL